MKDKSAKTVSTTLKFKLIPFLPRIPQKLLSDQGTEFTSVLFNEVLEEFAIEHVLASSHRPQTNGVTERVNRTILQTLRMMIQQNPTDWDLQLPQVVVKYNNTWHATIKATPSDFLVQRQHSCARGNPCLRQYWKSPAEKFSPFNIGDKVAYKSMFQGNLASNKFKPRFKGPYVITKVYDSTLAYDIAKYPINEREGVIQAHFSQLRKWVDVPRYLLRNPYFRQHLQNQLKQQDEDYQQNLAEINEEQGEIADEESLTGTELTPPVLPKDDSDEDDDDFSYQLAEEDHHLLEELRKRQKEAQEKMLELINNDYSTFLSNSYRVLQESFDAAIGINESQANSGSNRLAEVSKEDNITTNRFIQTDLTIPPEEEEEDEDLFQTTFGESFEGFCPLEYSVDQDSFEGFVPKALSTIMEEPDSYYQLNFSNEVNDEAANSLGEFDPEEFYIEETYMDLRLPLEVSPSEEEQQMDSGEPRPSPRRLRSHGEAPRIEYIMERPLEYKIRKEKES